MEIATARTFATALAFGALQLVNQGAFASGSGGMSTEAFGDDCSNTTLSWEMIAYTLGATTVFFILATCILSVCLCVVLCRGKKRQNPKDLQPLVHQASFSVPISNQVYMENEKGLAKPSEGPGSTNTFTPAGTTVHSSPLKRNSTSSSIASGGYVEMKGGALEDIISPPSSSTLSRISVPPAANPGWHTTQSLQHASTVSSTLPINPLDYENATAWILAEKIKEQNRIDCTDAADLPPTKPKLVATYQGDGLGSNHQPRSALTPPYLESTGEVVLQPPKLPPKRYKEIEFMTMEPTSEYMRPNISSSSLPRDPVTERSFKTHSNPHTLGRV